MSKCDVIKSIEVALAIFIIKFPIKIIKNLYRLLSAI
jgi:hypothetical protein